MSGSATSGGLTPRRMYFLHFSLESHIPSWPPLRKIPYLKPRAALLDVTSLTSDVMKKLISQKAISRKLADPSVHSAARNTSICSSSCRIKRRVLDWFRQPIIHLGLHALFWRYSLAAASTSFKAVGFREEVRHEFSLQQSIASHRPSTCFCCVLDFWPLGMSDDLALSNSRHQNCLWFPKDNHKADQLKKHIAWLKEAKVVYSAASFMIVFPEPMEQESRTACISPRSSLS